MAESISVATLRKLIQEQRSPRNSHMLLAIPPQAIDEGCDDPALEPMEPSAHIDAELSQLAPGDDVDISPRAQLHQALKNMAVLTDMLETGEELPHWAQAKLAKAAENIRAAKEYIQDAKQQEMGHMNMNETQADQFKTYVLGYINGHIQDSPDGANALLNNIIREEHTQLSVKVVEEAEDIEEELKGVNVNDPVATDFKELIDDLGPQEEPEQTPPGAFGVPTENDKQYECEPGEDCEENRGTGVAAFGTGGNTGAVVAP